MIVDLFAGCGGWDTGLALLGERDVVGLELDAAACATRAAAGHRTIRADVAECARVPFRGKVDGLIASPPCQDFSVAGKHAGIEGARGELMWQVPLWARVLRPRWIACEQVPPALEWWERFAYDLETLGYRTWRGILNAADYGVPQTRQRAFLLAALDRQPEPPRATHAKHPTAPLFGPTLERWVSMAEALGWGMTGRPGYTMTGSPDGGRSDGLGGSGARRAVRNERDAGRWTVEHRRGGDRIHEGRDPHAAPAECVTSRADRWQVLPQAAGVDLGGDLRVDAERVGIAGVVLDEGLGGEPEQPHFAVGEGHAGEHDSRLPVVNTGRDWKPGGTRDDAQKVPIDQPSPSVDGAHGGVGRWWLERPATTVQGDSRCWPPGHKVNGDDERRLGVEEAAARYGDRAGTEAIRLTISDALVLQSFPADYPVQGTKTKQFEQVGNAVPPLLAAHVLRQFVGAA